MPTLNRGLWRSCILFLTAGQFPAGHGGMSGFGPRSETEQPRQTYVQTHQLDAGASRSLEENCGPFETIYLNDAAQRQFGRPRTLEESRTWWASLPSEFQMRWRAALKAFPKHRTVQLQQSKALTSADDLCFAGCMASKAHHLLPLVGQATSKAPRWPVACTCWPAFAPLLYVFT